MNRTLTSTVIVTSLCGLLLIGEATAEKDREKSSASSPAAVAAPVAGVVPLGVTVAETQLIATGWRASKLIGAEVLNDAGDEVGEIDDFVVSPDGTLTIAVVQVGGFLGLGSHLVAIPVRQFTKFAPKAVLPGASKEELKKLPSFKYAQ